MVDEDPSQHHSVAASEPEPHHDSRRQAWIHHGSQVVCAATVVLTFVAADRYQRIQKPVGNSADNAFVLLLLAGLTFLLALAVALFRPERGQFRQLVATAAAWSIALLLALAGVWA